MRASHFLFLAGITLLSSAHSCRVDKPDPAPSATQTGAGTFACKVDGREWTGAERFNSTGNLPAVAASWAGGTLEIRSQRALSSGGGYLNLHLESVNGPGTYPVTVPQQGTGPMVLLTYTDDNATGTVYNVAAPHSGTITITRFDTNAHVVSGTFEGTVVSPGPNPASHQLTEGRFDAKLD